MNEETYDSIPDAHLLAHIDGELSADLAERIDSSTELSERVAQITQLENGLRNQLFRFNCPDSLLLNEYAAGLAAETEPITAHLQICPYCVAEVAQVQQFLKASAQDISRDLLTRTRVLIARLLPDLSGAAFLGAPVLSGVRGSTAAPLTYEADDFQVSLELLDDQNQPGSRQIIGLILGPEMSSWRVYGWQADRVSVTAEVDELGNFVIVGLEPGTYDLSLTAEGVAIQIRELVV